MKQELFPEIADSGLRIDKYLSTVNEQLSRSYIQKLLKSGLVLVDGKPVKASYQVEEGEVISLDIPEAVEPEIEPEDMDLDILYEDMDVILINKPKGMVVHPAAGHYSHTLVNGLMYHCKDQLSGINGVMRPGIVHRIDMDTTGVIIACKNDMAHNSIAAQLKEHSITRRYQAIVHGVLKDDTGTIDAPIGRHPTDRKKMSINYNHGKNAVTHYKVLKRFRQYTHVECRLETGRTHQIRAHLAGTGHPLLGDYKYGSKKWNDRYKKEWKIKDQVLHAYQLTMPGMKRELENLSEKTFYAKVPETFWKLIKETAWEHGTQEALEVLH